jgi:hypothetical protein
MSKISKQLSANLGRKLPFPPRKLWYNRPTGSGASPSNLGWNKIKSTVMTGAILGACFVLETVRLGRLRPLQTINYPMKAHHLNWYTHHALRTPSRGSGQFIPRIGLSDQERRSNHPISQYPISNILPGASHDVRCCDHRRWGGGLCDWP